jgi:hypothetical protein
VKVRSYVPRTTSDIRDRPAIDGLDEFCECGQHRPAERLCRELGAETLGVIVGDGVVGRPYTGHIGRFDHADKSFVPNRNIGKHRNQTSVVN